MNIIRVSGGLERQLFQYALYMKFESMGVETKFDDINEFRDERTRPIMLSVFNIDYPRATWDEIVRYTDQSRDLGPRLRRLFGKTHTNIYSENGFYDPEVLNQRDTYIEGKFMSQKYFEDILPHVHDDARRGDGGHGEGQRRHDPAREDPGQSVRKEQRGQGNI